MPNVRASSGERRLISGVGGIILAAGLSRRYGANKLLAPLMGRPLIHWGVTAALASRVDVVAVVTGHERDLVRAALTGPSSDSRLIFVDNHDYEQGQSTSVIAGLAAIAATCAAAIFIPADQPGLDASIIDRLIAEFELGLHDICLPTFRGQRRSPVLFGAMHFSNLCRLKGDLGGRSVIDANLDRVAEVDFDREMPFMDVDRPDDIAALSSMQEIDSSSAAALMRALDLGCASVIAICGSGGKTSLMEALVRECQVAGERVLATSTTKLAAAEADGPWHPIQATNAEDVLAQAARISAPVLAYHAVDPRQEKLIGFAPEVIDTLARSKCFKRIFVEADGSRRRALKAPSEHEPAFPASADAVIMVAGANGLGQPADERTIFRIERWSALVGTDDPQFVTPNSLARVIVHPEGLARTAPPCARRILFINQADTQERREAAFQVLECVFASGGMTPERAAIGQLVPEPQISFIRKNTLNSVGDAQ